MDCPTVLTYIYSSPSLEALDNLITSIKNTFYTNLTVDDMFYTGVFCNVDVYANYQHYDRYCGEVPEMFLCDSSDSDTREAYVKNLIRMIMKGEIEKPDWMEWVEEESVCGIFNDAPSTFLYLIPKNDKYADFAEKLTDFLYSPNMISSIKNETIFKNKKS